jgi:hypothetical protein
MLQRLLLQQQDAAHPQMPSPVETGHSLMKKRERKMRRVMKGTKTKGMWGEATATLMEIQTPKTLP